jgi:hypothetical protein
MLEEIHQFTILCKTVKITLTCLVKNTYSILRNSQSDVLRSQRMSLPHVPEVSDLAGYQFHVMFCAAAKRL